MEEIQENNKVKEAITFLKDYIAYSRKERQSIEWQDFNEYCEKYCIAIEVLINEIEKGNKENEK